METRKVMKVGGKSYAITLPKKWVKALNLKPGDSVTLVLNKDKTINVQFKFEVEATQESPSRIEMDISSIPLGVLSHLITGLYALGFDEVIFKNYPPQTPDLLNALVPKLPGVVVLESTPGVILIKMAIMEKMIDLNEISTRMISVLNAMYDMMDEFISKSDEKYSKELLKMDDELDRLYFLGLRLINRGCAFQKLTTTLYQELLDISAFIKSLEQVGDALDRSTRILQHIDFYTWREELEKTFMQSRKIIFDAITSFTNIYIEVLPRFVMRRREFKENLAQFRQKYPMLQGVASELELILAIATDIMELSIHKYIRNIPQEKKT